jgi:hypothetical protein
VATDVDICNLALGLLGDAATVASINPPEGSAQASHCARFYPIARDALLEMSTWGFATVRVVLAQVTCNYAQWRYEYEAPSDMVNSIAVLDSVACDDYATAYVAGYYPYGAPNSGEAIYDPQPYAVEFDPVLGVAVILSNQENASLRYTQVVSDTTLFSPTFVSTLAYMLASYLAGPIIKGDAGMAVAKSMREQAMAMLAVSRPSDANQGMQRVTQSTPWMIGR